MVSKYFTVEVRPEMNVTNDGQHLEYSDGDILFNWSRVYLPKGGGRLIGVHVEIRPKGDAGSTPNKFPLELLFEADNFSHPDATPRSSSYSLGSENAAPSTFAAASGGITGVAHKFLGTVPIIAADFADSIDPIAIASTSDTNGVILQQPHTNNTDELADNSGNDSHNFSNVYSKQSDPYIPADGYTGFSIAGIAKGAFNFISSTEINNGDLDGPTMTVSGTDPRLFMIPGDTVKARTGSGTSDFKAMGVIESLTETTIVLKEAFTTTAVADTDVIYNTQPIRILLTFER